MKLFGAKPDDLPYNLRTQILGWLQDTPADVEGCIRPGCVHLTVSLTFSSRQHYERALHSVPAGILRSLGKAGSGDMAPWCRKDTAVWLPDRWMKLQGGQLVESGWHSEGTGAAAGVSISAPIASVSGRTVAICGPELRDRDFKVLCRLHGRYHELPVTWAADEYGQLTAHARLPRCKDRAGLAWLEVLLDETTASSSGRLEMAGHPKPLLICESEAAAEGVCKIWAGCTGGSLQDEGGILLQVLDCLLHRQGDVSQCTDTLVPLMSNAMLCAAASTIASWLMLSRHANEVSTSMVAFKPGVRRASEGAC